MVGKALVERVGGTQENGPWPEEIEEIVEGKAYRRPVTATDGSEQELKVNVTGVNDILDSDGQPTGGQVVAYQFDDPTLDGGGTL
jgi:hypothetical protein